MDKDEIIFWRDKYDESEDSYNKGLETDLRKKFQENQYITKDDLVEVVKWKFHELPNRKKRILGFVDKEDDEFIMAISRLAFKVKEDKHKLKLFCCIDGVGCSLTSVILTFYDPVDFGIVDIRVWRALFNEEKQEFLINDVIIFLDKLRKVSKELNLPCRDIEKAYFKKDKDK